MRKLKIIEHISLDGVIQAPGVPNEDGDYPYGGWTAPYRDPAAGETILEAHSKPFDLLLGRHTYDTWSGFWPKARAVRSRTASTRPRNTSQPTGPIVLNGARSRALDRKIVEGVRRIKAKDAPDLILWGSSTLTSTLLEHGLADGVLLLIYPILLGKGKRFFLEGIPARKLALTGTKAASSGVVISTYRPSGPLRTGSFDDGRRKPTS